MLDFAGALAGVVAALVGLGELGDGHVDDSKLVGAVGSQRGRAVVRMVSVLGRPRPKWGEGAVVPTAEAGCSWRRLSAAVIVAAAAVLGSGAGPAGGQDGGDVADRLIATVDGWETVPEGAPVGQGSGPVTMADLMAIMGSTPVGVPADMAGYMRVFHGPGGQAAAAIGLRIRGSDAEAFLGGFTDAGAAQGRTINLLPGEPAPLGRLTAYEVPTTAGAPTVVTAFVADDLAVVLVVTGMVGQTADDDVSALRDVLRDIARAQAELTPPTTVAGARPGGDDEDPDIYRAAGRIIGGLLSLGLVVGVVYLVIWWRRRRHPSVSLGPQGWPPSTPHPPDVPPGASSSPPTSGAPFGDESRSHRGDADWEPPR